MRYKPLALLFALSAPVVVGCAPAAQRLGLADASRIASLQGGATGQNGTAKGTAKDNAAVARVTTRLLAQAHYARRPLDADMSSQLLDRFLDVWDPQHLYFTQADVAEFERWRSTLGGMVEKGDTSPANVIFARFLERADAQSAFVKEALKSDKFVFEGDENYRYDRKDAPRPKDLEEAKKFWMDRLRFEYLQEKLNTTKPEKIAKTLEDRYTRISRTLHEYDADDVFEVFLTSVAHLYDPHTDYLAPRTEEQFNIDLRLSLFGIGALLGSEDGYSKIEELIAGGPALKSGKLKVGDRIVGVAQGEGEFVDTRDMRNDKVVQMIRGPKGTKVRLLIWPVDASDPATRREVVLIRDQIKLEDQEAKAQIIESAATGGGKPRRIGVIDLPSFYADFGGDSRTGKSATADVAKLIRKLKAEGVEGIVLDLRRNGGGSLQEAVSLTGLFIKSGPVVQVKSYDDSVNVLEDEDSAVAWDGPMLVLTSRMSASASEILTGALQDYGRAAIVGDTATFGKGTVQEMVSLQRAMERLEPQAKANAGALKLTIQKFYRPSGMSNQLEGIKADIPLPSVTDNDEIGEKSLENPLPWDKIDPARFQKSNKVQPFLPELRKRSQARITTDRDFTYVGKLVERRRKAQEQKTVSLNEAKRRAEKKENEAFAEAWRKEVKERKPSADKVYPITVATSAQPGLPAPLKPGETKAGTTTRPQPKPEGDDAADVTSNVALPDVTLEEAKRILRDLISLSGVSTPVARKN